MNTLKKPFIYVPLALLVAGVGLLVSVYDNPEAATDPDTAQTERTGALQINDRCVTLAVADTQIERNQGLSNREDLPNDEGMLFLFDNPDRHGFWMKDMNFPIDIIWLDDENQVVDLKQSVSPETYPETFEPSKNAKKVVELNAGFANQENINRGDALKISIGTSASSSDCGVFSGN